MLQPRMARGNVAALRSSIVAFVRPRHFYFRLLNLFIKLQCHGGEAAAAARRSRRSKGKVRSKRQSSGSGRGAPSGEAAARACTRPHAAAALQAAKQRQRPRRSKRPSKRRSSRAYMRRRPDVLSADHVHLLISCIANASAGSADEAEAAAAAAEDAADTENTSGCRRMYLLVRHACEDDAWYNNPSSPTL